MSSVVLQSNKGKENQNSKNVQLKSKNSRENIDGTTGRPGARRRFGTEIPSNGQKIKGISKGHNGKSKHTTKRKTGMGYKENQDRPDADIPPSKRGKKVKGTIVIMTPKMESLKEAGESCSILKDEEKDEVFGDDMDDSQDEANQITEYADETDLWGSDQETERINDYWLD